MLAHDLAFGDVSKSPPFAPPGHAEAVLAGSEPARAGWIGGDGPGIEAESYWVCCNGRLYSDMTQNCRFTYGLVDSRLAACLTTARVCFGVVPANAIFDILFGAEFPLHDDWMPEPGGNYRGGVAQAEFVKLKYPGE